MNSHARAEAALRRGRPLAPTAEPAVGDVLWIMGSPFRLVAVVNASGRGDDRFRVYRLADHKGNVIDVTPGGRSCTTR